MTDVRLVFPMAAMVLLTYAVAIVMVRRRFGAARAGEVKVSNFRVNRFDDDVPLPMLQAGRNYINLFEAPVLFYAACLAAIAGDLGDTTLVAMAWAYVAARVLHSVIHLGGNNVMTRLRAFALSLVVLAAMWIYLVVRALGVAA